MLEDQDQHHDGRKPDPALPLIYKGQRRHISPAERERLRLERQADRILAEAELMGYEEAAAYKGVGVRTLQRGVERGDLGVYRIAGGRYRFRREDLDAWSPPRRGRPRKGVRREPRRVPTDERVADRRRILSERTLERRTFGTDSIEEMEERRAAAGARGQLSRQLYDHWDQEVLRDGAEFDYWASRAPTDEDFELWGEADDAEDEPAA